MEARTAKYIIVMLVQTSTSTASTISCRYRHRTAIRCESEAIVYNLDTALSSYVNTTIGLDYYYVEARDCEVHHCHARSALDLDGFHDSCTYVIQCGSEAVYSFWS